MTTVGIVSFQGDFERHIERTRALGMRALPVRDAQAVATVDALILPGGESTTIGMLLDRFHMLEIIRKRIADGLPVLGTCAGAILLADYVEGSTQPLVGGLHIAIQRNAYGRQIESFEADLVVKDRSWSSWDAASVHGVFIRAPIIASISEEVQVILEFENKPVMVRQGKILAATFHPELTPDLRVHDFFFNSVAGFKTSADTR